MLATTCELWVLVFLVSLAVRRLCLLPYCTWVPLYFFLYSDSLNVDNKEGIPSTVNNNNNNCLKSNIQCIEIRVQWTVHLGSSHMHVHAVTRVHAVTPKLVICVMYLTSIWRILLMTDGLNAVWSNDRAAHTDTNPKNLELAPPQSITATRLDQLVYSPNYYIQIFQTQNNCPQWEANLHPARSVSWAFATTPRVARTGRIGFVGIVPPPLESDQSTWWPPPIYSFSVISLCRSTCLFSFSESDIFLICFLVMFSNMRSKQLEEWASDKLLWNTSTWKFRIYGIRVPST